MSGSWLNARQPTTVTGNARKAVVPVNPPEGKKLQNSPARPQPEHDENTPTLRRSAQFPVPPPPMRSTGRRFSPINAMSNSQHKNPLDARRERNHKRHEKRMQKLFG